MNDHESNGKSDRKSNRRPDRNKAPSSASAEDEDQRYSEDGEGFLQRWSRRKHRAARDELQDQDVQPGDGKATDKEPEDATDTDDSIDTAAQLDEPEKQEPEPPGDEDMPPLESIDQGGSVKDFFSPNVSKRLRGAALKRLFFQPEFSAPDMLEEYAGDYSKPELLGDTVTVEMKYRAEQALKFAERKLKAAAEQASKQDGHAPVPLPDNAEADARRVTIAAVDREQESDPAQAPNDASAAEAETDEAADAAASAEHPIAKKPS